MTSIALGYLIGEGPLPVVYDDLRFAISTGQTDIALSLVEEIRRKHANTLVALDRATCTSETNRPDGDLSDGWLTLRKLSAASDR